MAGETATNWRKVLACLCVLLIVAGVAVGLGVGLTRKSSNVSNNNVEGPPLLGDHLLSSAQEQMLNDSLLLPSDDQSVAAASISITAKKWPTSTIPFAFSPSLPATLVTNAQTAMQRIMDVTCIKFVARTAGQSNFLYFEPYSTAANGGACQSIVGVNGASYNSINMGQYCDPGRCIHEILHALGFNHEHVRADRSRYVTFHPENIDPSLSDPQTIARTNFAIVTDTTTDTPYDLLSIMHYPLNGFAAPGKQVLQLVDPNFGGKDQVGQLKVLSEGDKAALNSLYCRGSQPAPAPTPSPTPADAQQTRFVYLPCTNSSQCPRNGGTCANGYCTVTGSSPCSSHNDCFFGQYCATGRVCTACIGAKACATSASLDSRCDVCSTVCVIVNSPSMPQNTGVYKLAGAYASGDRNYRAWYRASIMGYTVNLFSWNNLWAVSYSTPAQGVLPDATHFSLSNVLLPTSAVAWNRAVNGRWVSDASVTLTPTTCPL